MSAAPPSLDGRALDTLRSLGFVFGSPADDEKHIATLRARLAIQGYELHEVRKDARAVYEVRRHGQAWTCSAVHDVEGLLAQISAAAKVVSNRGAQ